MRFVAISSRPLEAIDRIGSTAGLRDSAVFHSAIRAGRIEQHPDQAGCHVVAFGPDYSNPLVTSQLYP